ncbi:MAG: hypothetical protein RI907_3779 [Pseudomonadota bacterium]|jgi:TatD DNase family protein
MWIDTHCHLDAAEFDPDRPEVIARARAAGVGLIVVPGVCARLWDAVRAAAEACDGAYALGIHPLYVHEQPADEALGALDIALQQHRGDPRLVAVGEIGLDHFVPEGQTDEGRALQQRLYSGQLQLAAREGLPVILHVRRSADALLAGLRQAQREGRAVPGGIAHAFNGSLQQAEAFVALGFKLGFGGAMTHPRALQIRRLATALGPDDWVLETDAPDIPPVWRHVPLAERQVWLAAQRGLAPGAPPTTPPWRTEPVDLHQIGAEMAALRGISLGDCLRQQAHNARAALPRLAN